MIMLSKETETAIFKYLLLHSIYCYQSSPWTRICCLYGLLKTITWVVYFFDFM